MKNMRIHKIFLLLSLSLVVAGCAWLPPDEDKTKNWSAHRFYTEGKKALNDRNYEEAIQFFEGLETRYPYGRYAEQAQLEIAYSYYKFGEPDMAIAAADRFIQLHPTHPYVDYAYYLKGLAHFSTKQDFLDRLGGKPDLSDRDPKAARQAFEAFRELVTRFPNSKYTPDATQRMAYLINALARHNISVAKYYLQRGVYVAVVNRSKYVIEHYQHAPAVEDALGVMAIAYRKMGLVTLAVDALRVLETNFPNSRYLTEVKELAAVSQ